MPVATYWILSAGRLEDAMLSCVGSPMPSFAEGFMGFPFPLRPSISAAASVALRPRHQPTARTHRSCLTLAETGEAFGFDRALAWNSQDVPIRLQARPIS